MVCGNRLFLPCNSCGRDHAHMLTLLLQPLPLFVHISVKNIKELGSWHRGMMLHCLQLKIRRHHHMDFDMG